MTERRSQGSGACCVCAASDARTLTGVGLASGGRATLCGSHALMYRRAGAVARSEAELRALLVDRRNRRPRRRERDDLGEALTAAFSPRRRAADGQTTT